MNPSSTRTLVYEFGHGERGQGFGQALFSGIPFAYALARESGRALKLRVQVGGLPLSSYLGDRTGWSRDLPPPGAGPAFEFWTFWTSSPVEPIEAAAHSDESSITIRGNNLRPQDHAVRGSYFGELFELRVEREHEPDVVIHVRAGDLHAFGRGVFRDRDIREVVWKSGGLERAASHALDLALSACPSRVEHDVPTVMFLSDAPHARRWAVRQKRPARILTTSLDVRHSHGGDERDARLLLLDLSYMMNAPILIYTRGAFSQFAAAVNPGLCLALEDHIPSPRERPWHEQQWSRLWTRLRAMSHW